MKKTSKKTIAGWICVGFAVMGLMVSIPQGIKGADISMIIFFGVIGGTLIHFGKKTERRSAEESVSTNISFSNISDANTTQVVCTNCGASIQVNAETGGVCEYCGSHVAVQG